MLKRINIVGTSGSGKSTFSRQLAKTLSIDYIEMDAIFWLKDWTCPNDEDFFPKLAAAIDQTSWVLDGNYSRTIDIKWAKADTVIWLDFSFTRTLWQAIKRSTSRAITQQELWPNTGNKESFQRSWFSKDSILLWVLQTYKRNRKEYTAAMTNPKFAHITFVRLTSPKQCANYLAQIKPLVQGESAATNGSGFRN